MRNLAFTRGRATRYFVYGKKRKCSMRRYFIAIISGAALAMIVSAPAVMFAEDFSQGKAAGTPAATSAEIAIDPLPCFAAIAANDDDTIISRCDSLIANEKNTRPDRIKAALARAAAYDHKQQYDRAVADYDTALQLDPAQADAFNHRGEVWRKKGDRPHALADFGAAIRLNPEHSPARGNYKSLAQELELLGAQMAVSNRPSFNCATAKRAVEKAICADPELARLDSRRVGKGAKRRAHHLDSGQR
jgi:tetratricopeptide (TPR) repeat protein